MKHQNRVRRNLNPARKSTQARVTRSCGDRAVAYRRNLQWRALLRLVIASLPADERRAADLLWALGDIMPECQARKEFSKFYWGLIDSYQSLQSFLPRRGSCMETLIRHFWDPDLKNFENFEMVWQGLMEDSNDLREMFLEALASSWELRKTVQSKFELRIYMLQLSLQLVTGRPVPALDQAYIDADLSGLMPSGQLKLAA